MIILQQLFSVVCGGDDGSSHAMDNETVTHEFFFLFL